MGFKGKEDIQKEECKYNLFWRDKCGRWYFPFVNCLCFQQAAQTMAFFLLYALCQNYSGK